MTDRRTHILCADNRSQDQKTDADPFFHFDMSSSFQWLM